MNPTTLYTIGHGNLDLQSFLNLLQEAGIQTLVDVRAQPHSRSYPHFDQENLRVELEALGMVYHWAGRHLGGHRQAAANSPHTALAEDMRGFADHMQTHDFEIAVAQLRNLATRAPTAILCAERDPERCHRRLICDYLVLRGMQVMHLLPGESRPHALSPEARRESAQLIYDRRA
jgi:uncharacterized protein (DUF488 family)